ncbi:Hpt domain-containing protein [Parvibium lacunae]|uniref:Chemotaxis protein CheA n=1 Tax=Parvibium lacunae TaxID=1888893 RepID=A0A368L4T3_9BURK|nr:Hpt domain-containing protein [Parvibium lacunae]RCS58525.1 response regulator [Parvibium lacunae]
MTEQYGSNTMSSSIDTSSLGWVLGEIRQCLSHSSQALQAFRAQGDTAQLRVARTGLHQAHGALQIVGVDGVSILTEEVEHLYEQFETNPESCTDAAQQAIEQAFAAILDYLDELQHGGSHHPLRLFPYFRDLLVARGADRIHPADLFFPDLSLRPPKQEGGVSLTPDLLARERALFERALLHFLRDKHNTEAIEQMLAAVSAIEETQRASAQRTFWWVTKAFLQALQENALPTDLNVQRLCARINLQMRRLLDEAAPVAERLLKDTLFFVARSNARHPLVDEVKAMYRLQGIVPEDFENVRYSKTDAQLASQFHDRLETAKQTWNRVVGGGQAEIKAFGDEMTGLQKVAQTMQHPGVAQLTETLQNVATQLLQAHSSPSDALGLDVATALLFLETAATQHDPQLDTRAEKLAQHVQAVAAGQPVADELEWLSDISRRAQERVSLIGVAREIQHALSENEKLIDNYFRDTTQRDPLSQCQNGLNQVIGAFSVLGQPAAVDLARQLQQQLQGFVEQAEVPPQAVLENFAQAYGALGFLTESILHHPESVNQAYEYDSARYKFTLPANPVPFDSLTSSAGAVSASDDELAFVADSPVQVAPPADITPLVADIAESTAAITDALLTLTQASPPPTITPKGLVGVIESSVAHAVPMPSIPTSQTEIDAELLEIFLGEAEEVLETISQAHQVCEKTPTDQEQLILIRRGFHTLKGSSRMVGLNPFGEAAWALEQTMNAWLADRRAATPDLLAMISQAQQALADWVRDLQQHNGQSAQTPDALIELARRVRAGEPLAQSATVLATADSPAESQEIDVLALDPLVPEAVVEEIRFDIPLEATLPTLAEQDSAANLALPLLEEPLEALALGALETVEPHAEDPLLDATVPSLDSTETESEPADLPAETVPPPVAEIISLVPPEPASVPKDDTVYVGDMPVSAPLYNIFLTEADDLVRQIERDFAEWRHEDRSPSFLAQRSVHSLAGIAATVGFKDLRSVAATFEDCLALVAQQDLRPTPTEHQRYAVILDEIRAMLQQFSAGVLPPTPVALLESLRQWRTELHEQASQKTNSLQAEIEKSAARRAEESAQAADEISAVVVDSGESAIDLLAAAHLEQTAPLPAPGVESVSTASTPEPDTAESLSEPALSAPLPAAATLAEIKLPDEIQDDIDPELLVVFVEEANDYLPEIGATLRAWQAQPNQGQYPQSLLRQLHTVKGSARMAGAMRLGQLIHDIETRVESVSGLANIPPGIIDDLLSAHDQTLHLFEQLQHPAATNTVTQEQAAPLADLIELDAPVAPVAANDANVSPLTAETVALTPVLSPQSFAGLTPAARAPVAATAGTALQPQVRVRADLLDRLVNQAGEVSIARSRVENEVNTLRGALTDLTENVSRLRSQLREIEIQAESQMQSQLSFVREREGQFDPLEFDRFTRFQELTRMMAESVNDVATIQQNLVKGVDKAQEGLLVQARNARELQQDLMSVRMVQFGSIAERLYRVVRQAAKELDKRVNLDIRGGNVELDRGVLERMVGPFEHLLRNAVVHGIESRADRVAAGKAETGELQIEVRQEGGEVVLTFIDDGAGLNVGRIRERALTLGLLTEERDITDREAADFIFTPGFSTASEVTELAGRGVGMDVVKFEAAELGGRVGLDFTVGAGARFTIHLPLTLAVTQVVLVRVGEKVYALPSVLVEQVQQLKPQALANAYNAGVVEWLGEKVAVRYLATLLGDLAQHPMAQRYSPLIILRSGIQRLALHVDEIVGNQEAVVKNIGPQVARVPGVAGATVMGSGEIVLILNPVQLAERSQAHAVNPTLLQVQPDGSVAAPGAIAEVQQNSATTKVQGLNTVPTIMVVDDSLTVRRVTQRLLQREGYQVLLAKDGVDALQQVQESTPDVMLVDIEMPRMDGFDLTRNIRSDERLKNVPIIMITSRTAEKHRNYALSIGVNVYLGKPYQEPELLQHIGEFVGDRKPKVVHA